MANGNEGGTLVSVFAVFLKEKLALFLWTLGVSIVGFLGSYRILAYRVEQNVVETAAIRSAMAIKVDEDQKQVEILASIERVRGDIIATIHAEAEDRIVMNGQITQEVRRANERIDVLLSESRYHATHNNNN